jgi:penicillin amidase
VRARRIRDLLEEAIRAGRKLDRAAMETIQLDAVSEPLRGLASAFMPALPPDLAAGFRGWDGRADSGSRPFLVARALRRQLEQVVRRAWRITPDQLPIPEYRLVDIGRASADAWWKAGLGEKDVVLAECAEAAVRELTNRFGSDTSRWRWGEANRLQVRHPLGRVFGLSWLFDPPGAPQSGATGTPRAAAPAFGQSMRFVVDWGDPDAATLVVPFGVSGHVGSPHRLDQHPYWLGGDPTGAATRLERPAPGERIVFRP